MILFYEEKPMHVRIDMLSQVILGETVYQNQFSNICYPNKSQVTTNSCLFIITFIIKINS